MDKWVGGMDGNDGWMGCIRFMNKINRQGGWMGWTDGLDKVNGWMEEIDGSDA